MEKSAFTRLNLIRGIAIIGTVLGLHGVALGADDDETIEEIVVVGTQIKGAKIAGALPVSVITAEDIEAFGVDAGDELLENISENGMNMFNEAENASGGVNSSRGDVGAYNLRNMGTGNTLTLLNGRRLVNSPGYQTELLGGDFVPATTVNSNLIPVNGMDRVEILRDGASAIYGADAVAGVVNYVIDANYEGYSLKTKFTGFDHFDAQDVTLSFKAGFDANDGATNVSIYVDRYSRDRIRASEDARWGNSDHRHLIPEDSLWAGDTRFRNTSTNSLYGQFDLVDSSELAGTDYADYDRVFTDSNGEFEVFPLGDERCSNRSSQNGQVFDTGYGTCIAEDGNGVERFNMWGGTDQRSELDRTNFFVFVNHELENGNESFTEFGYYTSESNLTRHPSFAFSSSKHRLGPDHYYLNQLAVDGNTIFAGQNVYIDNYRYAEIPRIVNVEKKTYRILQGFRGSFEKWDWEGAFLASKATSDDVTSNRLSNNLIKEALYDSTPAAYNPFSAGVDSNIERAVIDVYRYGESELRMFDIKFSNGAIFDLPAGPVGMLVGLETRREEISDDRDPRLDGTITYTDYEGDTYPLVADVLNSSPTGDVEGDRRVTSLFGELQVPLFDKVNAQFALRHEDFSDVDSSTVGKIAVGWDATDWLALRGSFSTAFRAPNIIQINEKIVVRTGTRNDYTIVRVQQLTGTDDGDVDSRYSMQRQATGAENLLPEESDNWSVGFVLTPGDIGLLVTADWWSIEKENTIGLFGRNNHTVNDMVLRFANGTSNCDTFMGNPAVVREAPDNDTLEYFETAGICPVGEIKYVADNYLNLATRTIEGHDIAVYYNLESELGDFSVRYIGSFIDTFEQVPGGEFSSLQEQQASGAIPADIPLDGFGDLLGMDGNYDNKHTVRVAWRKGDFAANVTALRKGSFYQNSLTLSDGTQYIIPEMTTMDVTLAYYFDLMDAKSRVRFAIKNVNDERAPLADRYYGYFADAHQDLGRNYYIDLRVSF